MDESYLDALLKGATSNDKQNSSVDSAVNSDASIDLDFDDLGDISLGELDELDDLDLGDLEVDDIDFDDVDVTSLNTKKPEPVKEQAPEEDFNLDELLGGVEEEPVEEYQQPDLEPEDIMGMAEAISREDETDMSTVYEEPVFPMEELDMTPAPQQEEAPQDVAGMDLDDLFSALGIDDESEGSPYTAGEDELDALFSATMADGLESGDLDDIMDMDEAAAHSKKKKKPGEKKTISEILFGEPDEDDIEEEKYFEAQKLKKQDKKQEKLAAKEAKLQAKKEAEDQKKAAMGAKQREKKLKKEERDRILMAELEAEKDEKKVSTPTVIVVFALFVALAILVIFGTKLFDYKQVIKRAADYFDRQRYRLAYEEVCGVEVKEEDEDLRDRIYTVMYVERLYESYENNVSLGRYDMALDALLRGVEKYDLHYQEAIELDIVEDIDVCRDKILTALQTVYGISPSEAYDIMQLEGQEYTETLLEYCEGIETGE